MSWWNRVVRSVLLHSKGHAIMIPQLARVSSGIQVLLSKLGHVLGELASFSRLLFVPICPFTCS